jgi:hypothetical protein
MLERYKDLEAVAGTLGDRSWSFPSADRFSAVAAR